MTTWNVSVLLYIQSAPSRNPAYSKNRDYTASIRYNFSYVAAYNWGPSKDIFWADFSAPCNTIPFLLWDGDEESSYAALA